MLNFSIFSLNGQILPIQEAKLDLTNIEFTYGYGVYETLKIRKNKLFFVDRHVERILVSAKEIFLRHNLENSQIRNWIVSFCKQLSIDQDLNFSCNLKVILLGGKTPQQYKLYILPLAPLFVERKNYKNGAMAATFFYSRWQPNSKSLNMLPSYVYFSIAKGLDCYDCLFLDENKNLLEGSRTNLFLISGKTIYTPPKIQVLDGITRQTVIETAQKLNYEIKEVKIKLDQIQNYDNLFLTSTSAKILPISKLLLTHLQDFKKIDKQIQEVDFNHPSENLKKLMEVYDSYLDKPNEEIFNLEDV